MPLKCPLKSPGNSSRRQINLKISLTKQKIPRFFLYTLFIVAGILLIIAAGILSTDNRITVANSTSSTYSYTGAGNANVKLSGNLTYDHDVYLSFTSTGPIQIHVSASEIGLSESYAVDASSLDNPVEISYLGYKYLAIGSDIQVPLGIEVVKPLGTTPTVTVAIVEQTGLPRYVDAWGYLIPGLFALVFGIVLVISLLFRDLDGNGFFHVSPFLRDGGRIARVALFVGLVVTIATAFEVPQGTYLLTYLFPLVLPLAYLSFTSDLWGKLQESVLALLPFALCELAVITWFEPIGEVLANYQFGLWASGHSLLMLVIVYIGQVVLISTGSFLLTVPTMRDLYQFWRVRGTKRYQVAKYSRQLQQMLDIAPLPDNIELLLNAVIKQDRSIPYPVSWRSESFIQFLKQLDFEMIAGHVVIFRPEFGLFLLPLVLDDTGFNMQSKPLWVPKFCTLACTLISSGEVPFNACLITQLKGYASQKFTPREIEIVSIALFLRDGEKQEILTKITEGTINIRYPEHCRGCANLEFIRKEGTGDLPDRPEIEIN